MISPDLLLQGYRLGVFPMAMRDDSIEWFSPDPRAILPLEDFHVPHALRRLLRKRVFETTTNKAFSEVIEACAKREDTWINREIIESYIRLHELGHAHAIEAWKQGRLVGGLYGVAVGGAFFAESLPAPVAESRRASAEISVESHVVATCLLGPPGWAKTAGVARDRHCHSERSEESLA